MNSLHYCRLCGTLKNSLELINLLEDSDDRDELLRKLHRINAIVDFSCTILPQTVCVVCVVVLERAFDFVSNVEKAQTDLGVIFSGKIKEDFVCAEEGSLGEPEVELKCQIDLDCYSAELNIVADSQSSSLVAFEEIEYQDVKPRKTIVKTFDPIEPETSNNRKNTADFFLGKNNESTEQPQQTVEHGTLPQQEGPWNDFKWMCHFCDTEFATRKELNSHAMQFHDCCNPYRCNDCQVRVSSLKRFLVHINQHPKWKNLKSSCYICFKQYSSSSEMHTHPKDHYENMKHYCRGCLALFNDEKELENHTNSYYIVVQQNLVKPLIDQTERLTCLICQKTLKNKRSLNTHLLTHTNREKNHKCDTCGQSYFSKWTLTRHKKRTHQCGTILM